MLVEYFLTFCDFRSFFFSKAIKSRAKAGSFTERTIFDSILKGHFARAISPISRRFSRWNRSDSDSTHFSFLESLVLLLLPKNALFRLLPPIRWASSICGGGVYKPAQTLWWILVWQWRYKPCGLSLGDISLVAPLCLGGATFFRHVAWWRHCRAIVSGPCVRSSCTMSLTDVAHSYLIIVSMYCWFVCLSIPSFTG